MKKLLFFACALICATNVSAQKSGFVTIDLNEIKTTVAEHPEKIKKLIARTSTLDSTLSNKDRMTAYCGQSYISNDGEVLDEMDIDKYLHEGAMGMALTTAKNILKRNPLNIKALHTAGNTMFKIYKDSITTSKNGKLYKDSISNYFSRLGALLWAIKSTGDGSQAHPFLVTKIDDEYMVMHLLLNLKDFGTQTQTDHFDVFSLKTKSSHYDKPYIYFDITRVLEIKRLLFPNTTNTNTSNGIKSNATDNKK